MITEIGIDGTRFLINGSRTYPGAAHSGKPVEGLLFNTEMKRAFYARTAEITGCSHGGDG